MKTSSLVLVAAMSALGCARAPAKQPYRPPPAEAQLVSFRAADGAALHGYFYLPAGQGPGPFPAVLWNHGSERLPGWQPDLAAFYTARGFAFFRARRVRAPEGGRGGLGGDGAGVLRAGAREGAVASGIGRKRDPSRGGRRTTG